MVENLRKRALEYVKDRLHEGKIRALEVELAQEYARKWNNDEIRYPELSEELWILGQEKGINFDRTLELIFDIVNPPK